MAENSFNLDTGSFSELSLDSPLTLDQAVNMVLERNPDLHIANQRIARTEALVGESLAAFYPQVKARLAYLYSDDPSRVFGMIVSQRRFTQQDFVNINNPGSATDFRPEVAGTIS
ncbi:MAG: TolC family protein, partial [Methylococcales bacterium]|nr:TolC family protein [Methylococcales bacterium]